ncbi:MICOS complex subunit mic25-a isoform X6 [Oryzias latipes]
MGANGSSARNVSFGLDDDKKVTVIEGVRLSGDVCRRMREAQASGKPKPPSVPPEGQKPGAHPEGVSTKEAQEEMRKNFEHQQALVQEQLAKLAQKEKEVSAATGLKDSSAAAIMERGRAHHEQEKAKPADLDAWCFKARLQVCCHCHSTQQHFQRYSARKLHIIRASSKGDFTCKHTSSKHQKAAVQRKVQPVQARSLQMCFWGLCASAK